MSPALHVLAAALLTTATLAAQAIDIGPPPGRLIDVGGRKLHVNCTGQSQGTGPTVILEAGASSFAIDWSLVQPEIARTYRVCSYDRAGSGWSDPRPDVETPARIVADLHALLATSDRVAIQLEPARPAHHFLGVNAIRNPDQIDHRRVV
jgi:pimeloyl-ACP methyl ester carboxylesterase